MRILHTSDWHLGRTLHGVDLLEHQAAHLDHLVELTRSEAVDAVVVAGDVYDRAIPPVDAVSLLSEAVTRLAEHAHVVVTPGNHDSAVRLGFGDRLLRPGVHVRARLADVGAPVVLGPRPGAAGGDGSPLLVYALPYLDPDTARHVLADAGDTPDAPGTEGWAAPRRWPGSARAVPRGRHGAALRRVAADLARRRAADPEVRAVVVGHAFVVGGLASDSERDIRVGGVDAVPAAAFAGRGADYVALGHLHGPQRVTVPDVGGVSTVARYSGSPLAFSFSELHQRKSTALVDVGRLRTDADAAVELVPALCPAASPR